MRLKFTLLLLVLNIVLFGLIYYLETGPAPELPGTGPVLTAGLVENTDYLEIEGENLDAHWVLNRTGELWRISSPITWAANFYAVSRILNQLQFLEKESSFSVSEIKNAGRSLEDYGLAQPRAVLTLGRGRERTSLRIGEATGIGDRLYILSPDESEVYVVSRDLIESISIELEELRESKVFSIPLFEAQSLRVVVSPGNTIVRIEKAEQGWRFLTPIQTEADSALVEATLNQLTAIRVSDFHPIDLPVQGLDDASITLRVTVEGNNRRQTLWLGGGGLNSSGERRNFAKLSDNSTVFSIPSEPFDNLLRAQETLREKNFVRFTPASLNGIEIAAGDSRVTLQKFEAGGWQLPTKDSSGALVGWPAEPELVFDLINALRDLEAVSFPKNAPAEADLDRFGLTEPQRRVTLRAATEQTLLLGDADLPGDLIYAKIDAEPFVYQVHKDIIRHLQVRPLHYRSRIFHNQPQSAVVESLTLTDLETDEVLFVLETKAGSGTPENDVASDFSEALSLLPDNEREAAEILLRYASKFKVRSYLRDEFSEEFNLGDKAFAWKTLLEANINLPGGSEDQLRAYKFYFTERLGGTTQIGGSPDYGLVFELNQEMIDSLFALGFRREALDVEDVRPPPVVSEPEPEVEPETPTGDSLETTPDDGDDE